MSNENFLTVRKALLEEAKLCYSFIEDARRYQAQLGFEQWHADYPTLQIIEQDINLGIGYVFVDKDKPIGYMCLIFDGEPAYKNIDGNWLRNEPYAVIHRMAFSQSARGKGISKHAFQRVKELCKSLNVFSIRIDTQAENVVMKHILEREGFKYCGQIQFDGGPKLAYELDF